MTNRATYRGGRGRRAVSLVLALLLCGSLVRAAVWTEFERAIGKLALEEMRLRHGLIEDPLLQAWVDGVAAPVTAQSTRHLIFEFHILGSYEDNAFSLPGGTICVTRGLLTHVTSDEELAGVIAHEIAHAEDRDFQRMLQQQLLHYGGQSLLRGHVADEWVYVAQLVGVLDGLRKQRQHELQADLKGTEMAYAARYDPEGIATFLAQMGPHRDFTGDLLATHPGPTKRLQAVRAYIGVLQQGDGPGLIAVGDLLRDRWHYARAAQLYEAAGRQTPAQPEAARRLADMRQRQGLADAGPEVDVALTDEQQGRVAATIAEMRRREQDLTAAEKRLRGKLVRFMQDRDIARALEISQVIAPETREIAYLTALARAYYVLNAGWTEAMRQGEILSRSGAIRAGWERSATDLQKPYKVKQGTAANGAELVLAAERFEQSGPAIAATTASVSRAADAAGELSAATRMVALAFLALVGSGSNQPLGRLNYTRFLLVQGDLALAEQRLDRVGKIGREVHTEIIRRHLEALGQQVSVLHATGRPALRDLDVRLIARRLPGDLAATALPLLGEALLARHVPANATVPQLQALDAIVRMCYLDLRAERQN